MTQGAEFINETKNKAREMIPGPSLSIVTICRNSSETVRKTIDSVLEQKTGSDEYLLVDGASTDGTQDIIRSYGGAIDFFLSEPDEGIADAFNKGIARASGEVVALINSDDQLLPGALETIRTFFQEHPDVMVAHGDVLLFHGDQFVKRMRPAGRWWYPWRMVIFNHPATFVRRETYVEHGGFDNNYKLTMDVDIFMRWVKAGVNIDYCPASLVRMQAGGASGQFPFQVFSEKRRALIAHGFSPLLANLQFVAVFFLLFIVSLRSFFRKKSK